MGESRKEALSVGLDGSTRLEFHGATVSSDGGFLAYRDLDAVYRSRFKPNEGKILLPARGITRYTAPKWPATVAGGSPTRNSVLRDILSLGAAVGCGVWQHHGPKEPASC
jgi:hypothetical protein